MMPTTNGKNMKEITAFIAIANDGQDIRTTNYWNTGFAMAGLCFVCTNAGAIRLLVPKAGECYIDEMRTGKKVTVERGFQNPLAVDVVFEDGTDTPFRISMDRQQIDGPLCPQMRAPFTVWTEAGKQLQLLADVMEL